MSVPEGLLTRLARINPTSVFLGALALILVALFVPGVAGGALLLVVAVVLGVLALHSQQRSPAAILLRLVTVTLVLALALTKIF